jgi:hypothetical protein
MARFWLNLGWDDCHFVLLLLWTNHHFGWGCKTKKIPEENNWLISHSLHASCNNNNVRAVCTWVLGYLLLHCIFSSLAVQTLQLTRYLPFFLMLQQLCMQCNAMQYRVEHWPLLITVYLQLIFGKSCRNNYFFFSLFGKKKEKKKKEKNRRIWQS